MFLSVNESVCLTDELCFQLLHAIDRANLIYDAFSLAEAEQLPYDVALNMTDYLNGETHYIPWAVAAKEFHALKRRLYGTDAHDLFKVSAVILSAVNVRPVA